MEIIDKSSHALVTEYSVGDVIQDGGSAYMVVQISSSNYGVVDLGDGSVSSGCVSLNELYYETHTSSEQKVKATVVIEGEEN